MGALVLGVGLLGSFIPLDLLLPLVLLFALAYLVFYVFIFQPPKPQLYYASNTFFFIPFFMLILIYFRNIFSSYSTDSKIFFFNVMKDTFWRNLFLI